MSLYSFLYPPGLLLGLGLSLCSLYAGAATFTVTNLNDSGAGSLRQAISDANALIDDDTIVFQSGLSGTISLTSGPLNIDRNLTINGPGADMLAVSGNAVSQVFQIGTAGFADCDGPTVFISGLTIKDGYGRIGGGIVNGGGTLTVSNSILTGNAAHDLHSGGGGIATLIVMCASGRAVGHLTVINSTLTDNSAISEPGSIFGSPGGGIWFGGGTATIINSTLSGNSATGAGGGVLNFGTLTIINSTLSDNSADYSGGGIFNSQGGTLMLGNSLVAGNTAPTGQEIFNVTEPGTVGEVGVFVSEGHNLIGVNGISGVEGATLAATDIIPAVGITAIIASLDNNGGPTPTHPLVLDSPAIDSGDNALIPTDIATDQRGFPRIQNGTVDIGAVEVAATMPIPTLSQWALLVLGLLLAGLPWLPQGGRTGRLR